MKRCARCRVEHLISDFVKNKTKRDGLHHTCKSCQSVYRLENRARLLAGKRAWYLANREKVLRMSALNYELNKLQIRAYQTEYYKVNAQSIMKIKKDYRARNPEMVQRWNAIRRGLTSEHPGTSPRLRSILLGFPCYICGKPSEHIDHIYPVSRGGIDEPQNVAPACAFCNLSKHDKTLEEWKPGQASELYESAFASQAQAASVLEDNSE